MTGLFLALAVIGIADVKRDWLVAPLDDPVRLEEYNDKSEIVLTNGLMMARLKSLQVWVGCLFLW